MDSPAKASSCFSFLPKVTKRRSFKSTRKCSAKARVSWPTIPDTPLCSKDQVDESVNFPAEGSVKTFAVCKVYQSTHSSSKRFTVSPFFGPFAGREIIFDLRTLAEPLTSVKVKLLHEESLLHVTTFYHRGRPGAKSGDNVKDRCIRFLHGSDNTIVPSECGKNQQPKTLQFLCKQAIVLHVRELDISKLPKRFSYIQPDSADIQEVTIKVWWPCPQTPPTLLQLNLLKGISVSEVKWMLCHRLSLPLDPTCLELYRNDCIECMPSDGTLNTDSSLNCVVLSSVDSTRSMSTSVTVSIIGQGIDQIIVDKSMTLLEFQESVRSTFSLKQSSFIYFPSVCHNFKNKVVAESGLRMTATIDNSTMTLINSMRRNFPIVDGVPSLLMDYSRIPLYQLHVSELHLSSPLVGFEVTGPTIPLQITTAHGHEVSKDFVVVSQRVHAVSVNPKWTVDTLLKYMECVSRFPCYAIQLGTTKLSGSALVGQYLTNRCWLIQSQQGLTLAKDIPIVQH